MNARDVMTAAVVTVSPETPTHEIAHILDERGISAVPVVDAAGAPIGMISEGDLIGRDEPARNARRDWWLTLLAEGETLHPDFLANLRQPKLVARDVMACPVVSVGADATIAAIAKLLTDYRIKRVPVVTGGRIVGIVSRADLVRALAAEDEGKVDAVNRGGLVARALVGIDRSFRHLHHHTGSDDASASVHPTAPDDTLLTVDDFRSLVDGHNHKLSADRKEHQHALLEHRRQRIVELIDHHITDANWRSLVHDARQAAERGEKQFLLLRFPSDLCSDAGRAINVVQPEWPQTLRGEAAEIYLRWEHDLQPHGFHLSAQVLDFPGGMPGDIGLFLVWGE